MAFELIHTSASRGLRQESGGFCTVAMTTGMPTILEERLETLGGYRPHGDSLHAEPSFSHLRLEIGGHSQHVLMSVRPALPDASGRANKLAHFLVLSSAELTHAGPAWILRQPGVVVDRFEGPPRWIPEPRTLPKSPSVSPRRSEAWERACGDAGWAGELVNRFLLDASRLSAVIYGPECDPLELIDEALALMPPEDRWRVTFSTHFQSAIAGVHCAWRFCLEGTPAALEASRRANGLFLDLRETRVKGLRAGHGRYAELAREGHAAWWSDLVEETKAQRVAERAQRARSSESPGQGMVQDSAPNLAVAAPGARVNEPRPAIAAVSPRRSSARVAQTIALVAVVALLTAAAALAIDRSWKPFGSEPLAAELNSARLDLQAARREIEALTQALRDGERALHSEEARARMLEVDLAKARDDSTQATKTIERLTQEMLAKARPPESAADNQARAVSREGDGRTDAPASTTAPPSPNGPAAPSGELAGQSGPPESTPPPSARPPAVPPATTPVTGAEVVIPFERFQRRVSPILGSIEADRQLLVTLRAPIQSMAIELPRELSAVSTQRGTEPHSIILIAAGPPDQPRAMATIVPVDAQLFIQWDGTNAPRTHERWLSQADTAISVMTIVVTLSDGSIQRLSASPRTLSLELHRGTEATVLLDPPSPELTLRLEPAPGWTTSPTSTDPTQATASHAGGQLSASLDRTRGVVVVLFISPLRAQVEATERELARLRRDRDALTLAEEHEFHDAKIREKESELEGLRRRMTNEIAQRPSIMPVIVVENSLLQRPVLLIKPSLKVDRGGRSR
ncbi:MAG: hypothetical protein KF724_12720 [Phycisphaeraceae bacterium]|nr:hypothetical protein [Phycisphaeraceae bacterium]